MRTRTPPFRRALGGAALLAGLSACATGGASLPTPPVLETSSADVLATAWSVELADDMEDFLPVPCVREVSDGGAGLRPCILAIMDPGAAGFDAADGEIVWRRPDLRIRGETHVAAVPGSDVAMVEDGDIDRFVSLSTGETLWSSADLPWARIDGYLPVPPAPLLLVTGRDSADRPMVGAVRVRTGVPAWTADWWEEKLETGRTTRVQAHLHLFPPLLVADSLVVVWGTEDGPTALDAYSGAVRWTVPSLAGRNVPRIALEGRRAAWLARDGVLYIPYEKRLAAVATASGEVLWDVELQDPAGRMELLGESLLVQGWGVQKGSLELIEAGTGASTWGGPTRGLDRPGPYVRLGPERVFLATKDKLTAVSLLDGSKTAIGAFDFEAGEGPVFARALGDRGCFAAEQNIACVDPDGALAYRRYYAEPDKNLVRGLLNLYSFVSLASAMYQTASLAQTQMAYGSASQMDVLYAGQHYDVMFDQVLDDLLFSQLLTAYGVNRLAVRVGATNYMRERGVFLTKREDGSGDNRWTVVEIALADGSELGARPLEDKPDRLLADPASERILVQDDRRLLALELRPVPAPGPGESTGAEGAPSDSDDLP